VIDTAGMRRTKLRRSDKEQLVKDLSNEISEASAIFLANYQGLNFSQMENVRSAIKSLDSNFKVVKNRLLKLALKKQEIEGLDEFLAQPTACAIVKGEPTSVAKELKKFSKDYKDFEIKCGYFESSVLTEKEVIALADIPSREELLSKMLGSMTAPARNFVSLLANVPRSFLNVLNAIKDQKENN